MLGAGVGEGAVLLPANFAPSASSVTPKNTMAGQFNEGVAKSVIQGRVAITASAFVPLVANSDGVTPYENRRHVRIQLKSVPGGAMALAYVSPNADGTFTTPTTSVKLLTIMPGNTTWIEPVGAMCMIYGKLVKKVGFTSGSISAVVTEYR